MQRNHSTTDYTSSHKFELTHKVAFHEAGHAVAIYLRNKQQDLPPVFFQIAFLDYAEQNTQGSYLAKIEGGRLIENLPYSLEYLSDQDKQAYLTAFEADIVNLLAGPLAEAKYIANSDGETISRYLVNFAALGSYGGASDLELVDDYIHCFTHNMQQRSSKIQQLLVEAFKFIDNPRYWRAINVLAMHIIQTSKK